MLVDVSSQVGLIPDPPVYVRSLGSTDLKKAYLCTNDKESSNWITIVQFIELDVSQLIGLRKLFTNLCRCHDCSYFIARLR